MVKIEEIASTSTFAWSSDTLPLLATGTVAGAVDINFTSSSVLEIYNIFAPTGPKEPVFSASVDARFYAIAWSKPFDGRPQGLIAGAFEDGSIEFWDAAVLIKSKDLQAALVHKSSKHTLGPAKSIAFNPLQPQILVSGGSKGQLFIWNCATFDEPTSPGNAMTPMDEVTSVAWNNTVSHIFASTGNSGYTSVWDLKAKREVLHLQYSAPGSGARANFSQVAWHPSISTKLVTASDNDACPVILTWDLRNANAPEQVMSGHNKGVLSLDWCRQDPSLLLSSGKDNTTLLWNPQTAAKLGEYPTTANWTFHVRFAPAAPDIFATASFDGKVVVQTLQDTSPPVSATVAAAATQGGDDAFWSQISTTETQQPKFDQLQAPEWLKCPCSVSFGFGNKLAIVTTSDGKSSVSVSKFASGSTSDDQFKQALGSGKFDDLIRVRSSQSTTALDTSDWHLLNLLNGDSGHFKQQFAPVAESSDEVQKEDSFFDHLDESVAYVPEGDFFLGSDPLVKFALANKRSKAVQHCLDNNLLEEALVLALDSATSEALREKVRNAYFNKHKSTTVSRVLYSITKGEIDDVVVHADANDWQDIGAAIAAFTTDPILYQSQMSHLGDRVLANGNRADAMSCYAAGENLDSMAKVWLEETPEYEQALLQGENSRVRSPADARHATLDNFVQKIASYQSVNPQAQITDEGVIKAVLEYCTIVAGAGEFELAERFLPLLPEEVAKLERERISKATAKVAPQQAIGGRYGAAGTSVRPQSRPPSVMPQYQAHPRLTPTAGAPPIKPVGQQAAPPFPPTPSFSPAPAISNYAAPSPAAKGNPYARSNPYAPQQPQTPVMSSNPYAIPPPASVTSPTGPQFVSMNAGPPPPKKKEEGWNDLPDGLKISKPAKRAAAAVAPPQSTFGPSGSQAPPFMGANAAPQPGPSRKTSTNNVALPPPPPRTHLSRQPSAVSSPRLGNVGANAKYAPPPGTMAPPNQQFDAPQTRNGSSPIKAPPKNPYAPQAVPATPQMGPVPPSTNFAAPPAPAPVLPKNPYAPQATPSPGLTSAAGAFAPPPMSTMPIIGGPPAPSAPPKGHARPPVGPPPVGPPANGPPANGHFNGPSANGSVGAPPIGPPSVGPPPVVPPVTRASVAPPAVTPIPSGPHGLNGASAYAPPVAAPPVAAPPVAPPVAAPPVAAPAAAPAKTQYPAGDRSHIPEASRPIFESFDRVHEAIKPKIPERFAKHAVDMNKRLNILYDHLNNDDLLSDAAINELRKVSEALENKDFAAAASLNTALSTNFSDEMGQWNTGIKRLITMAEVMYQ